MKQTLKCLCGDSLELLKQYDDNTFDSVVTDPPYGLSFMGKKWDYDVPSVEIWKEVLRVLKPGGHLLSFGGSRTYHRMTVNVEDAGFEVRDQIMWVYGSGFPKSHNIGKAFSKKNGGLKQTGWVPKYPEGTRGAKQENPGSLFGADGHPEKPGYKPVYETNQYEGWGTALKPSHEPIVLARKPISEGTVLDNVIKWGTGGLNIDECRVPSGSEKVSTHSNGKGQTGDKGIYSKFENQQGSPEREGRFPANFIHDGSDEVTELFPDRKGGSFPEQRGKGINTPFGEGNPTEGGARQMKDDGSASRFFYSAKVSKKERNAGLDVDIESNKRPIGVAYNDNGGVHTDDRVKVGNNHPTVKPVALMAYLCRLITPKGGMVLDPFMGSGSTGMAAKQEGFSFTGIDLDENYVEISTNRIKNWV